MRSLDFCYWSLAITVVYLSFLLSQRRYRLLLPSVIHTSVWLVTIVLIICQLKGFMVSKMTGDKIFDHSSIFICALMTSSVVGFTIAHVVTARQETEQNVQLMESDKIENVLNRFKWIPYTCCIVGTILTVYIISMIGDVDSFGDYRLMAIMTKKVGYAAIAQRISGHVNILGGFFLMLLGYKYGQTGIDMKNFFKYVVFCSATNMSIGGRVWILTSTLPFLIAFFFSRKYSQVDDDIRQKDNKLMLYIILIIISLFSIIGILRGNSGESNFLDKFLYLTDGSRMTNIVYNTFPEGTFGYEYGKSTLLQGIVDSPMTQRFAQSISHDIGLSVTVKSIMPYLYYDFGFWGGAAFWGMICFFIEYICIRLKYSRNVISIIIFCLLSGILFQSPVGAIFANNTPVFYWIIILYIFRNRIFNTTTS